MSLHYYRQAAEMKEHGLTGSRLIPWPIIVCTQLLQTYPGQSTTFRITWSYITQYTDACFLESIAIRVAHTLRARSLSSRLRPQLEAINDNFIVEAA